MKSRTRLRRTVCSVARGKKKEGDCARKTAGYGQSLLSTPPPSSSYITPHWQEGHSPPCRLPQNWSPTLLLFSFYGTMTLKIVIILSVLTGVSGSPTVKIRPEVDSVDMTAHPNSVPEVLEGSEIFGQVRGNQQWWVWFAACVNQVFQVRNKIICTEEELHYKRKQIYILCCSRYYIKIVLYIVQKSLQACIEYWAASFHSNHHILDFRTLAAEQRSHGAKIKEINMFSQGQTIW